MGKTIELLSLSDLWLSSRAQKTNISIQGGVEIKDINKTSLFIGILSAHLLNPPPKPKYDFLCTPSLNAFRSFTSNVDLAYY